MHLSSGTTLRLVNKISAGGEGTIYATSRPSYIVKVYHRDKLTEALKLKIEKMSELNIKNKANIFQIAWPEEVAFNSEKKFIGYLMKRIEGKTLQELCFVPKAAELNNLKRKDLVRIALNILQAFTYLHLKNIVIGDINPLNILIDQSNNYRVGLIDTDSYQIGNFTCEVGTLKFTRPKLLRKGINFNTYRRTPADEAFAVAVLIFSILMLGKHPYSYRGGEDVIENMKLGNFPYRLKNLDVSSEETPVGPWKAIWSHIHPIVREPLGQVLTEQKEIKNMDDLIKYEKELIKALNTYLHFIETGKSTNELIPKYIWLPDTIEKVNVKCSKCGYEFKMSKDLYEKILKRGDNPLCIIHLQEKYLKNNFTKKNTDKNRKKILNIDKNKPIYNSQNLNSYRNYTNFQQNKSPVNKSNESYILKTLSASYKISKTLFKVSFKAIKVAYEIGNKFLK